MSSNNKKDEKSQQLINAISVENELFHDKYLNPYIYITSLNVCLKVKSDKFSDWLQREAWVKCNMSLTKNASDEVTALLTAKARYDKECRDVSQRLAKIDDIVYVDLANALGEVVQITKHGYNITASKDVMFIRNDSSLELPLPVQGGHLDQLKQFVNYGTEEQWKLLVAWLVHVHIPLGAFAILNLEGEQGCGKSTLSSMCVNLVDPTKAPLRSASGSERDLMINAYNRWVLCFDNLSGTKGWLSDALCRISTGAGYATRKHYSDGDEHIIEVTRPILLNGIDPIATRSDLLSRSVVLNLPIFKREARVAEHELWAEFEQLKPEILGALYSAVAVVLRELPNVKLAEKPRMTTYAMVGTALEKHLGWHTGEFMEVYSRHIEMQSNAVVENDLVFTAIMRIISSKPFSGTATELLDKMNKDADWDTKKAHAWPKTAQQLSKAVNRLAPDLRNAGVKVEQNRSSNRKVIVLSLNDAYDDKNTDDSYIPF